MEGRRFDEFAKTLALGAAPRRRLLRGLAGGALAALLGRLAPEATAAACIRPDSKRRCARKRDCCAGDCVNRRCRCLEGESCGRRCCPAGEVCNPDGRCGPDAVQGCPATANCCNTEQQSCSACGETNNCLCMPTTRGFAACVDILGGPATCPCPSGGCAAGEVCIDCGAAGGTCCVPVCP